MRYAQGASPFVTHMGWRPSTQKDWEATIPEFEASPMLTPAALAAQARQENQPALNVAAPVMLRSTSVLANCYRLVLSYRFDLKADVAFLLFGFFFLLHLSLASLVAGPFVALAPVVGPCHVVSRQRHPHGKRVANTFGHLDHQQRFWRHFVATLPVGLVLATPGLLWGRARLSV